MFLFSIYKKDFLNNISIIVMLNKNNFKIRAYIIHCEQNIKRKKKCYKLLKKLNEIEGITASIFPCIHFKDEWLKKNGKPNNKFIKFYKNNGFSKNAEMTPIEVAIALSHKLTVNSFLKTSNYDYCIVFEDDVTLYNDFSIYLENILISIQNYFCKKCKKENCKHAMRIKNFALLYLWNLNAGRTRSKQKKIITTKNKIDIWEETVGHNAGGQAYLFSRKFAEKEAENPYPIKSQSDVHNGYDSFEKYSNKMAYLTVRMEQNLKRKLCSGTKIKKRIINDKWYDDTCITSPIVHSPWYDDSTSHSSLPDNFKMKDWKYFNILESSKIKEDMPKKYLFIKN